MDRNSGTNIPPPYLLTQTQGRIDKRGLTSTPQPIPPKGLLLILPSHPRHRFYQATPSKALRSHSSHAQTSDSKTIVTDAFYVCTELFAFAAFSSSQYLNLMVNVLAKEQSKTHDQHPIRT